MCHRPAIPSLPNGKNGCSRWRATAPSTSTSASMGVPRVPPNGKGLRLIVRACWIHKATMPSRVMFRIDTFPELRYARYIQLPPSIRVASPRSSRYDVVKARPKNGWTIIDLRAAAVTTNSTMSPGSTTCSWSGWCDSDVCEKR